MKQEEITLKTKKAMADSLKKTMKQKPFSKITIKDIITDCNVNRNTFYYHFEDIYGLLHWMFDNEAIQVVQNFNFMTDYEEAIRFVIDYVEQNDHILNCALDSIGQKELKHLFYPEFCNIMNSFLNKAQEQFHIALDPDYQEFLIHFYTEALAGMLVEWIRKKASSTASTKENFIAYVSSTLKHSLQGIFSNSSLCHKV